MAFRSVKDLLVWYGNAKALLNDLHDKKEFDPSCPMMVMLEGLTHFYDPSPLISEQSLRAIYERLYGLDLEDGEEPQDIECISIEDMEGVEELTRKLKDEGKVAQVIGMTEMCARVGYHPVHMRNLLKKNTPPIQYAWKANHASGIGWWRFSVEQLDNFKRWLANLGKYPEQKPEIDPGSNVFEQEDRDGKVRMVGARGNVYEIEDQEYGGPLREW